MSSPALLVFDVSISSSFSSRQNILRFVVPFGEIVSFKYLLHTAGVEKGEPRGYCFIEFSTREVLRTFV